jgi:hypothetical protein
MIVPKGSLSVIALIATGAASLSAETIRIRVEDGRNGKAITNEHVQVWINGRKGAALTLIPGPDGVSMLEVPAGGLIEIESSHYKDCRPFTKDAPRPTYSIDEVTRDGVVAQNSCGKLRAAARRGGLLFFVRPLRWWEGIGR